MFFLTLSWILKLTAYILHKSDLTVYFSCAYFITTGLVGMSLCLFFFLLKSDARQAWTTCNSNFFKNNYRYSDNNKNKNTSSIRSALPPPEEERYTLVGHSNKCKNNSNSSPLHSLKNTSSPSHVYHRQRIVHQSSQDDCTVPETPRGDCDEAAEPLNGGMRYETQYHQSHFSRFVPENPHATGERHKAEGTGRSSRV